MVNGSPVYPCWQIQLAMCKETLHSAFKPQALIHGFEHFLLTHALSLEQSECVTHSGRQFGGAPIMSGRHEHEGLPFRLIQLALGPQGDG